MVSSRCIGDTCPKGRGRPQKHASPGPQANTEQARIRSAAATSPAVDRLQGNGPVSTPPALGPLPGATNAIPKPERRPECERGGLDDAPDQRRGACGGRDEAQIRKTIELAVHAWASTPNASAPQVYAAWVASRRSACERTLPRPGRWADGVQSSRSPGPALLIFDFLKVGCVRRGNWHVGSAAGRSGSPTQGGGRRKSIALYGLARLVPSGSMSALTVMVGYGLGVPALMVVVWR